MSADMKAVLWFVGAALAVVGAAIFALPLGVAAVGIVLMLRFH